MPPTYASAVEASEKRSSVQAAQSLGSTAPSPGGYITFWVVIWLFQWWLLPTWLVGSQNGIQTALQVLPAVVVAIFVLVLGSLFVLGQQSVTLHGARAAIVLPLNPRMRAIVWQPLLLTAAALLLSGQVPDQGAPSEPVTAAVATLMLATVGVLIYSTSSLYVLYSESTAPAIFSQQVLSGVLPHLRRGQSGNVVFRAGLLTEMLGQAVTRGDSTSVVAALRAIIQLHEAYLEAAKVNPDARRHTYDDGDTTQAWFANEVANGLVAAAMDAIASSRASEDDIDQILDTVGHIGERAASAHHPEEVEAMILALAKIATCVQQVQPSGAINHPARTLRLLAQLEEAAERAGDRERAALAMVCMMLALTYAESRFEQENPNFANSVRVLGEDPPFFDAGDILESEDWVGRWANKLPPLPLAVMMPVNWLQRTIEAHSTLHGRVAPTQPAPKDGRPWYLDGVTDKELAEMLGESRAATNRRTRRR